MIAPPPHSPFVWLFVMPVIVLIVYVGHTLLLILADLIGQAVSLIVRFVKRCR